MSPRPQAFYYEDYDTKSDPEYFYLGREADREFTRLEVEVKRLQVRVDEFEKIMLNGGLA